MEPLTLLRSAVEVLQTHPDWLVHGPRADRLVSWVAAVQSPEVVQYLAGEDGVVHTFLHPPQGRQAASSVVASVVARIARALATAGNVVPPACVATLLAGCWHDDMVLSEHCLQACTALLAAGVDVAAQAGPELSLFGRVLLQVQSPSLHVARAAADLMAALLRAGYQVSDGEARELKALCTAASPSHVQQALLDVLLGFLTHAYDPAAALLARLSALTWLPEMAVGSDRFLQSRSRKVLSRILQHELTKAPLQCGVRGREDGEDADPAFATALIHGFAAQGRVGWEAAIVAAAALLLHTQPVPASTLAVCRAVVLRPFHEFGYRGTDTSSLAEDAEAAFADLGPSGKRGLLVAATKAVQEHFVAEGSSAEGSGSGRELGAVVQAACSVAPQCSSEACLKALATLFSWVLGTEAARPLCQAGDVARGLLHIAGTGDSGPVVSALGALQLAQVLKDDPVAAQMCERALQCGCDQSWEVRESAFALLQAMLARRQLPRSAVAGIVPACLRATEDLAPYVRASAWDCLTELLGDPGQQEALARAVTPETIHSTIVSASQTDDNGYSRAQATKTLIALRAASQHDTGFQQACLCSLVRLAGADCNWEIGAHILATLSAMLGQGGAAEARAVLQAGALSLLTLTDGHPDRIVRLRTSECTEALAAALEAHLASDMDAAARAKALRRGLAEAAVRAQGSTLEQPEVSVLTLDDFFVIPREGAIAHHMDCY